MNRIAGVVVAAVVVAATGLLVAAAPAAASGLESHGIGARGRGMCSAMVAVADEWTAIHYNPAGLVQIEGRVFGLDYDLFVGTMESTKPLRNLSILLANPMRGDFVDPIGDEPASFGEDSGGATIHSGELGYATSWGRIAFGVGVYGSGSGAGWEDTILTGIGDVIDAEIAFQNASVNIPVCLAYQATPELSLGFRLAVHYGMLVADNSKYRSGAIPYTSATSQDTDGVGVSVDLGMLWKASERFTLGAVVKLPHTFEKSGETKAVQSLLGTAASPDTTVEESYPLRIALGCAYRPDDVNLLAFDVTWLDWSEYNMKTEYAPQIPAAGLVNMSGNFANWHDTVVLNFGYERRLNDRWTFRCGVGYDEAPEPTEAKTLVGGQVLDLWKFAVGAGLDWEKTTLSFGYTHMYGPEVDGYVPGAKYSMSLHELYVGFERRF